MLLTDVLRTEWGFDGYVTSDCGAINDITANHHYAPDGVTAAAQGLKAGCDTDCGGVYGAHTVDAVKAGYLSEATIDASLRRLVKIQMRLGLFEDKGSGRRLTPAKCGDAPEAAATVAPPPAGPIAAWCAPLRPPAQGRRAGRRRT